jgi:hypothetical protein
MTIGFDDAAREADFVFRGVVQRLEATTVSGIPTTPQTIVVRVDELLFGPPAFSGLEGSEVTVRLAGLQPVGQGDDLVFAANGWLVGDGLAVVELTHEPADQRNHLAERTSQVKDTRSNEELRARIAAADLVVVGTVTEIRPPTGPRLAAAEPDGRSEHEPDPMEAVVEVADVLKGSPPAQPVVIVFPRSEDVAWVYAPRFEQGQRGVFLLHSPQAVAQLAPAAIGAFTAPSELDVQPESSTEQIRALTERPPS